MIAKGRHSLTLGDSLDADFQLFLPGEAAGDIELGFHWNTSTLVGLFGWIGQELRCGGRNLDGRAEPDGPGAPAAGPFQLLAVGTAPGNAESTVIRVAVKVPARWSTWFPFGS